MSDGLKQRLLKDTQAEYVRETDGTNGSGVRCLGKNVLIRCDLVAEKTSGEIFLPPERIVTMNMAAQTGVLVALGGEAFAYYDDGTRWTDYKPIPGDRVFFEKYGGREILGVDGKTYRLMSYTCVGGIEDVTADQSSKKA